MAIGALCSLTLGIIISIKKNNIKMEQPDKKMMKTVLYTDKGKVSYSKDAMKEIPLASSLKPGQVLIKVECAVINPSDIYMM